MQTGLVIQYADVTIHEVSGEFEAAFPQVLNHVINVKNIEAT